MATAFLTSTTGSCTTWVRTDQHGVELITILSPRGYDRDPADSAEWRRIEAVWPSNEDLACLDSQFPREIFEEDWSRPR
jgi:hypothetical protein